MDFEYLVEFRNLKRFLGILMVIMENWKILRDFKES